MRIEDAPGRNSVRARVVDLAEAVLEDDEGEELRRAKWSGTRRESQLQRLAWTLRARDGEEGMVLTSAPAMIKPVTSAVMKVCVC